MHKVKNDGNRAVHESYGTTEAALRGMRNVFIIAKHAAHVYLKFNPGKLDYIAPLQPGEKDSKLDKALERVTALELLEKKLAAEQEQELKAPERKPPAKKTQEERQKRSLETVHYIPESEAETRLLIDLQLIDSGWDADTESLTHAKGARPQKGKNQAIAEWPFQGQPADYALFAGKKLVGIVEAKKASSDIPGAIQQSKRYAEAIQESDEYELAIATDGKTRAPFLFAANGRPYLEQFKEKSGIWFLDTREADNHPQAQHAFHSPDGLLTLLKQDIAEANRNLLNESYDYLQDPNGLSLRDYQLRVIQKTEEAIRRGKRNALIVMATGTGKTRTAVGLAYRLLKAERIRRILFLVDRTSLGDQAAENFTDAKIEGLLSFSKIYDIKGLQDRVPDINTRVHFATVQGLVQRLFFAEPEKRLAPDTYDLIIVDESHRGYNLDKELGDEELFYKNQWDYQSKYRQVLAYFDAVKVALTATPAKHTAEIFGHAVATYGYREAVLDGYLIDHEPPHIIKTALSEEGIKWEKGEKVTVYDSQRPLELSEMEVMDDDLKFDVAQFNRKVTTENFNKVIVDYLAKELDPDAPGKTLIFAATTMHADMLVRLLKEAYPGLDDDAIMKITGAPDTDKPKEKIRRFKNEKYPNIVVTVDYLTTGIDVPEICNIVFLRRISSRILYEQMIGRATRLCDRIGKDHFSIYDAVGIYETLKDYSQMKPVTANPQISFAGLLDELNRMEKPQDKRIQAEAILAKIQRKRRRMGAHATENFQTKSGRSGIKEFIAEVRAMETEKQTEFILANCDLFEFFDRAISYGGTLFLSDHPDELRGVERGYGEGRQKPADYIHSFKLYILDLSMKNEYAALRSILDRPSSLRRQDLKELLLHLEERHFDIRSLKLAYKEMNNKEMAASIIGFIRQQALGTPILSHSSRIHEAVEKLKTENDFNKNQTGWLDRIAEQLKRELVIDQESFDREPFKQKGGYKQLNKIFNNELPDLMERLHNEEYTA